MDQWTNGQMDQWTNGPMLKKKNSGVSWTRQTPAEDSAGAAHVKLHHLDHASGASLDVVTPAVEGEPFPHHRHLGVFGPARLGVAMLSWNLKGVLV